VFNEPVNGELFLAYVERVLVPTLTNGDIVIMDCVIRTPNRVDVLVQRDRDVFEGHPLWQRSNIFCTVRTRSGIIRSRSSDRRSQPGGWFRTGTISVLPVQWPWMFLRRRDCAPFCRCAKTFASSYAALMSAVSSWFWLVSTETESKSAAWVPATMIILASMMVQMIG
jgi:hypothetical protein